MINLLWAFVGVTIGTAVGVLPGLGPALTVALLLPLTFRLEPASAKDGAFRHSARELLALSAWRANDTAATRQWLDIIANDGDTPPGLRSRAEALQALLPPVAKS